MAEVTLQESEERYRTVVTVFAKTVRRAEPNGKIYADSPSWRAFIGQPYDEWKGVGWTSTFHTEDIARVCRYGNNV